MEEKSNITREDWIKHAVELLDADLFAGGLDLLNHNYQVGWGWTKCNKPVEVIFPYDGTDVQIDDLFPNTMLINVTNKDPEDMLAHLAYACIQCFYGIKRTNKKAFKTLAESFYFDEPFNKCHPSQYLKDIIHNVYQKMVVRYGEFPGKPVVLHKKEKTEHKKNTLRVFCPECGYEVKVYRKVFDKHGQKLPTCGCGTKMALDLEDEDAPEQE